ARTRIRPVDSHEGSDQCCFTGAIAAQTRVNRTGRNIQSNALQSFCILAISLMQILNSQSVQSVPMNLFATATLAAGLDLLRPRLEIRDDFLDRLISILRRARQGAPDN